MTRTLSLLFVFLFLASCGKGGGSSSKSSNNTEQDLAEISSPTTPAPVSAQTFEVKAKMKGFTRVQEGKVRDAFDLIKRVVATDEFKRRVLNKTYNGRKRFVDNNGLTNAQIYKKVLEAAERLTPAKNNTMDLELQTYFTNAKVIGYTMPSIRTIFMNRRYLNTFNPNQVAMNVFHEWLHKVGFGHAQKSTPSRPHSVPYGVGYIIRDLAKKY